jgi:GR25 family glycosyltransferase involved in LPS biosynthesis
MTKIPIYIITLDSRVDRQERISKVLNELQVSYEFIYSNKHDNQNFSPLPMANQLEVAIWNSHIRAMKQLLGSTYDWALILEDDAIMEQVSPEFIDQTIFRYLSFFSDRFGIIQLGWIPNSRKTGFEAAIARLFKLIFGVNRFDLKSQIVYLNEFGILDFLQITKKLKEASRRRMLPLVGMRLGSHAYLINRQAATELIQRFDNRHLIDDFKTIDQDLLSLTRTFRYGSAVNAIRFSRSLIEQLQIDSDNVNKTVY